MFWMFSLFVLFVSKSEIMTFEQIDICSIHLDLMCHALFIILFVRISKHVNLSSVLLNVVSMADVLEMELVHRFAYVKPGTLVLHA